MNGNYLILEKIMKHLQFIKKTITLKYENNGRNKGDGSKSAGGLGIFYIY